MTKSEFLLRLENELAKNNVSDIGDVIEEYKAHFDFKTAEGYSEDAVAESLGDPENVAKQYGAEKIPVGKGKKILSSVVAVCFDLLYAIFCVFMAAWEIVSTAAAVSFAAVSVWLFCGQKITLNSFSLEMPYAADLIFGILFVSLAVLAAAEMIYFFGFIKQFSSAYFRFRRNIKAKITGDAVLPPISVYPRFSVRKKTVLRALSVVSAVVFAVTLIVGYICCIAASGSLAFWHTWNWFV